MLRALLLVTVGCPMIAAAAPPADFLRAYSETRGFMLGRPVQPRPTPDGKAILFLRSPPRAPDLSLYQLDVASGSVREVISPEQLLHGAAEQLAPEERARRERARQTLRGFTAFQISDDGARLLLALSGRLYVVRRSDGRVTELATGPAPAIDPRFSPDGQHVAYVRERDLYLFDLATGHERRLTHSDDPRVSNGLAEFVAEEEMARATGYWFSPDGQTLAFEEADSRPVETFHLGDPAHPENQPSANPYPRAGRANVVVRVGLVAAKGGPPIWVQWDRVRLPYLATVKWERGGPLTLVVQSRDQRDLEVLSVDAKFGVTHRLLAEHDDAWINLDPSVPRWISDGTGFVWSTERGGSWALELRSKTGAFIRALGAGDEGYGGVLHVDEKRRVVHYLGSAEPTEQHLAAVFLDGEAAPAPPTPDAGMNQAVFAKAASVYTLTSTRFAEMPRTTVWSIDKDGAAQQVAELPSVAEAPAIELHAELVTVGAERFRAAITRPRGFDPARRYPVVLSVYGGPHHQQVTCALQPLLLRQWLAEHGFIVVAVDGRGTPRRGRAWERAIAGNFADPILDDQVAALDALGARYPELDLKRVGVFGWSFGGYLAALAVAKRPDRFQVAVAGAPVVDWADYDTHYTERYLGTPESNPDGYRKSSLLTYAATLERPLLLIHGVSDDNVYFLHTLKLADALFRAGRPFELLPLTGLTHMVPEPVVMEKLQARIAGALITVLRP